MGFKDEALLEFNVVWRSSTTSELTSEKISSLSDFFFFFFFHYAFSSTISRNRLSTYLIIRNLLPPRSDIAMLEISELFSSSKEFYSPFYNDSSFLPSGRGYAWRCTSVKGNKKKRGKRGSSKNCLVLSLAQTLISFFCGDKDVRHLPPYG